MNFVANFAENTGVDDVMATVEALWPNPTADYVNVSVNRKVEAVLYDLSGRRMTAYTLNEGNNTLNIAESGLYRIVYAYKECDAAPSAIATPIVEPQFDKLYIIGEVEGTNYTWEANLGQEMTSVGSGIFTATAQFGKEGFAEAYFALATQLGADANDWTTLNANRFGPEADGTVLVSETPASLVKTGEGAFKVASGKYEVLVDMVQLQIALKSISTDVENLESGSAIYVLDKMLVAKFAGKQTVVVYNTTGQAVASRIAEGEAQFSLTEGMYIVTIGNTPFKAIVR